jgi:serine/threonine protein kinase
VKLTTGNEPFWGPIVGRYSIIEPLGRGGVGTVYKALDTRLQRVVAIKVFHAGAVSMEKIWYQTQSTGLLKHPNIVQIYDCVETEGLVYLVVEYIEGVDLQQIIRLQRPIDPYRAIEIIHEAAKAVHHLHHVGFVHRDLKPSNILISNNGSIFLSDFGLAIASGTPTLTESGTVAGTPAYMSPEQAMGRFIDARSDIFSLGIILYELLTGLHPFAVGSTVQAMSSVVEHAPISPEQLNCALPVPLSEIVLKAMAKEPDQRFATCLEFVTALDQAKQGLAPDYSVHLNWESQTRLLALDTTGTQASVPSEPPAKPSPAKEVMQDLPRDTVLDLTPYTGPTAATGTILKYRHATASLLVFDPNGNSREFRLMDGVTIGRSPGDDLSISDTAVSRLYARIVLENGRFYITDLGSFSGTFVNGLAVEKQELHDQDEIRIGTDKRTLVFVQAGIHKNIGLEAQRRLEEFDSIWKQLTNSARDD